MIKKICLSALCLFILHSLALGELVDNNDGTITDTSTALIWQKSEPGMMTCETALSYCENLELAGNNDWRLPNRNELISITDYESYKPAIDTVFFPDASPTYMYWTSTTYSSDPDWAWRVLYDYGHVGWQIKSNSCYVRAVRGGL
jgi:hypothetical protein